ncbi:MAG: hypothetical protein CTY12_08090 [Methylotenera sp.]|nr:MAG: hypothetical protein CTY12_08090 [Methylotenera sp.]
MDCRNARAKVRIERIKANGGEHTQKEWLQLLEASTRCAVCNRAWDEIPLRPDGRYRHTWTKGHKIPILHGGTNKIGNIQAECYQCNFTKNAGKLKRDHLLTIDHQEKIKRKNDMAIKQERVSRRFSFILKSGVEVFPVLVKDSMTNNIAFRVTPGGTGSNLNINQDQVDEEAMVLRVLSHNYSVRCSSLDGKTTGLYKNGARSVEKVILAA